MKDYEELIVGCIDEYMKSDEFGDLMRRRVAECMEGAIEDSVRWGDLRKAMKDKINSVLVPYIERYDMAAYTAKLDLLLSEVAESTSLADNRKILENFRGLVSDVDGGPVTLDEVFEVYKRYVADEASGAEMGIVDGGYEPVTVRCEAAQYVTRGVFYRYESVVLSFAAEVPCEEEADALAREVHLTRWLDSLEEGYRVEMTLGDRPTIHSLVSMSPFDVFLARLNRGRVPVTGIRSMYDDVCIKAEPEYVLE